MAVPNSGAAKATASRIFNEHREGTQSEETAIPIHRMRDLDEGRSSPAGKRSQQEKRKSPHLLIRQVNGTAVDLGDTSASGDSSTHNDDFREMHARGHAMEELLVPQQPAQEGRVHESQPQRKKQKKTREDLMAAAQIEDEGAFAPVEPGNGRGNAGHVKRLVLEHFMNHDHLLVDFKPRLNFICGENGSGKTAILHGLQVSLGVSVKQSGRAATGGEFIKDDSNYCKTAATLWNTGSDAFMPRRYGHEVTVVREMKRTARNGASSTWSILDAKGRKVAARKADVDELLKALNVNAANPIVCLTQDTARSFGGSKADSERYRVYMEATQFDVIIEMLKLSEVDVDTIAARKKSLEKDIKAREKELEEVAEKLRRLEEVRVWGEQRGHLINMMAWQVVEDVEGSVRTIDTILQGSAREKMEAVAEQRQQLEKKLAAAREAQAAKEAAIRDFPERMGEFTAELQAQQTLYKEAKTDLNKLRRDLQRVKQDLASKEEAVQTTVETLEEMRKQFQETEEGEADATAAALTAKLSEVEGDEVSVSQKKQELRVAEAFMRTVKDEMKAQDGKIKGCSKKVVEAQQAASRIQSQQRGNAIGVFAPHNQGRQLMQLVADIEANLRRFDKPPLGPFGSLLTLTDDRWAVAVEASIGRIFNSFILHSHRDAALFRSMAQRIRGLSVPPHIIYSYSIPPYNLANSNVRQVPEELLTVFRVLKVKEVEYSHVIRNALLDQTSAERLLLVESSAEGMRHIRGQLSQSRVISSAWDPTGWHGVRRGRNETSIPLNRRMHARLRQDIAGALREAEQEVEACQQEMAQQQEELSSLRMRKAEADEGILAARREVAAATKKRQQTEAQIQDLKSQHESQVQNSGGSLEQMELEIAELTRELQTLRHEESEKQLEVDAAAERASQEDERLKAKKRELDAQTRELELEMQAQAETIARVQEAEQAMEEIEAAAQQLRDWVAEREREKAEAIESRDSQTEAATLVCSRAEGERSYETMRAMLEQRRRSFEHLPEDERPDDEMIMERWHKDLQSSSEARERAVGADSTQLLFKKDEHERWLGKRNIQLILLDQNYTLLEQSYKDRQSRARQMRKDTIKAITTAFNSFLHQRGFTGCLNMNQRDQELQLEVKTSRQEQQAVTDMKSLSGGERSFTNMCFIMAVGQQISSPFHCLDEFDVFMDAVNRQKAIQMLITFGLVNDHLQLILLTPQSTGAIEAAEVNVRTRHAEEWPEQDFILKRQMHPPRE